MGEGAINDMVRRIAFLILSTVPLMLAQVEAVTEAPVPRCHVGEGVHLSGTTLPECVVGTELGAGGTGTDSAWIYSALEFPQATSDSAKSCMVIESVVPNTWVAGWTPNIQMLLVRSTDGAPSLQTNFTARATYFGADSGQDIRNPKWGAEISVDDVPNHGGGGTLMSLWEPYVGTIHDIPTPVGLGTLNTPSPRRNMAYLVCRKNGPAHTSPFTDNGDDLQTGKIRVLQVVVRWEDASNVVQWIDFVPLTGTIYEVPESIGPDGTVRGYLDGQATTARLYLENPEEIWLAPQSNGICSIGGGTAPGCGTGNYLSGTDMLDGETDCLTVNTQVPEDVLMNSPVRVDYVFKPKGSSGDFLFQLSSAFQLQGADLSTAPPYNTETALAVVSCAENAQQFAVFTEMDMGGAVAGSLATLRICRVGDDALDTATSALTGLKVRIGWKRLVRLEAAP